MSHFLSLYVFSPVCLPLRFGCVRTRVGVAFPSFFPLFLLPLFCLSPLSLFIFLPLSLSLSLTLPLSLLSLSLSLSLSLVLFLSVLQLPRQYYLLPQRHIRHQLLRHQSGLGGLDTSALVRSKESRAIQPRSRHDETAGGWRIHLHTGSTTWLGSGL